MTAPYHRPYLLPTDLRTAEDVARWLREQIYEWDDDCDTANPRQVVACVAIALERRLDRERRQACERGAEDCERRLAELGPEPEEPTIDIWGTEALRARLRESALAFRAAASEVAGHLSSPDRAAARTP